jgi:hypothetical protein
MRQKIGPKPITKKLFVPSLHKKIPRPTMGMRKILTLSEKVMETYKTNIPIINYEKPQ